MGDLENPYNPEIPRQVFNVAPMDHEFRFWTGTLLVVLTLAPVGCIVLSVATGVGLVWGVWVSVAVLVIVSATVVILTYAYARPQCFEITSEGMRIVWPGRTRKLPKGAFTEMRIVTRTDLGRMTRCFGAGGLFGSFGWFRSEYMGNLDAYITRYDGMVYLRLKNRHPLLLTPDKHEEFLRAIRAVTQSK